MPVVAEQVVLVDMNDRELGTMEKMSAHREGLLHRAFSVFVFNANGDLLIQQRAAGKYHSAGLWSNTCCGHPRPGEKVKQAAERRLKEEMGFECELTTVLVFTYRAELAEGLSEHELDHVLIGMCNTTPQPSSAEVADHRYVSRDLLRMELERDPSVFTSWFPLCVWRAWDQFEIIRTR
ncbi:MAG: isopentenyl-diphosphate Delta-isomerase [Flavobacteriales bacterium]|nr:isopentenyl-diphosphate Delta-isomerase [Flavobacteriales bacterium]MCC6939188.1 isopentenyl-diphosphate Delta-isomerase [Flavobacteriales bacterium]